MRWHLFSRVDRMVLKSVCAERKWKTQYVVKLPLSQSLCPLSKGLKRNGVRSTSLWQTTCCICWVMRAYRVKKGRKLALWTDLSRFFKDRFISGTENVERRFKAKDGDIVNSPYISIFWQSDTSMFAFSDYLVGQQWDVKQENTALYSAVCGYWTFKAVAESVWRWLQCKCLVS